MKLRKTKLNKSDLKSTAEKSINLNASKEIYEAKDLALAAMFQDSNFIDNSKSLIEATLQMKQLDLKD